MIRFPVFLDQSIGMSSFTIQNNLHDACDDDDYETDDEILISGLESTKCDMIEFKNSLTDPMNSFDALHGIRSHFPQNIEAYTKVVEKANMVGINL